MRRCPIFSTALSFTLFAGLLSVCVPALAQDRADVEAVFGEPFGVGRLTIQLPADERLTPQAERDVELTSEEAAVLYPATEVPPLRALVRDALARPQRVTVYFLFKGDRQFDVTINGPVESTHRIIPRDNPGAHRRLVSSWWSAYVSESQRELRQAEYPVLVQNYLTSMLARRLGLQPPRATSGLFRSRGGDAEELLGLLTGAETVRAAMQKERMLEHTNRLEEADVPLPLSIASAAVQVPPTAEDVPVEEIAAHVPQECFYLRFGNYSNYRWFRATLAEWGGDLRNLISVRGLDYGMNERLERQLVLRESALSGLLGPTVIADVAMIGNDTFFREGASFGMLFQARNSAALSSDIRQQRSAALRADDQVKERTITIAGHDVSFLSTPDNSVRSFYAVDGDFHLVTTSRALVERFLEAGDGRGSLATAKDFRYARSVMPLERKDSVFVYLSDAFFREIVSPRYRVEMTRRLEAATDIELVEMARLAARAEGVPDDSIDDLIDVGLLPPHIAERADVSGPILLADTVIDSLRGAAGTFTPIPDIDFDMVTPSEARGYDRFAQFYEQQWQQMDPVMVGIQREKTDIENLERVAIELHAAPFARQHYGFLTQFLGPPTIERIVPVPEDLISLQVVVGGGLGSMFGMPGGVHHLFGGVQDSEPGGGRISFDLLGAQTWLRGYVGSWPSIGLLDFVTGRGQWDFDPDGYALGAIGLWQRRFGPFSVVSFNRDVLESVTPQLDVVEAERPAQVRAHVGDLSASQLSTVINAQIYDRADQISRGNARFLRVLTTQLKVAPDEALQVAGDLLNATLVCPLGGEYVLVQDEDGAARWASTAWPKGEKRPRYQVPDDYRAPPLEWFRGMELDFGVVENTLSAHVDLFVKRKPVSGFQLPTFPTVPTKPVEKDPDQPEELPSPGSDVQRD